MTCRYNKNREDNLDLMYYMKNALFDLIFYISATKQKIEGFFPTICIDKIIEIIIWNDWCCNAILLYIFSDPDLVEIVNGFIY